jgi:hypothetical protein
VYADRFRDPVVARTARDTYRTFLLREMPSGARNPESRRATVPIRALFGTGDIAVHPSLASPETARADDYTFELATPATSSSTSGRTSRRARLIALADETSTSRADVRSLDTPHLGLLCLLAGGVERLSRRSPRVRAAR